MRTYTIYHSLCILQIMGIFLFAGLFIAIIYKTIAYTYIVAIAFLLLFFIFFFNKVTAIKYRLTIKKYEIGITKSYFLFPFWVKKDKLLFKDIKNWSFRLYSSKAELCSLQLRLANEKLLKINVEDRASEKEMVLFINSLKPLIAQYNNENPLYKIAKADEKWANPHLLKVIFGIIVLLSICIVIFTKQIFLGIYLLFSSITALYFYNKK